MRNNIDFPPPLPTFDSVGSSGFIESLFGIEMLDMEVRLWGFPSKSQHGVEECSNILCMSFFVPFGFKCNPSPLRSDFKMFSLEI